MPDMPDYHRWLIEADRSLYQAKAQGRDRIVVAGAGIVLPEAADSAKI
jgi:diguanylate cyclase